MRILHTADWHVGKSLRGRSRAEEHEAVLAEVVGVAADAEVDVVLVAGDVFDSAAPPAEAERIVYRALLDLAGTGAAVVVVAGNHDDQRRLAAVAPLLALGGVTARATVAPADEGGVVPVRSRDGRETALVAAVPFLSQRHVVRADHLMRLDADEHATRYADRVARIVRSLTAPFRGDTVNLVAAHLMCHGGVLGGGERTAHTVFDYSVPGTAFPASTHYVALGHLHRHQEVAAPCPARYSGSPLQLDFGESTDEKAVVLVDAAPGRPARAEVRPLTAGRRLRTVRGSLAELAALPDGTGHDHLRVVVREPARPGLAEEVRDRFPEAVEVRVEPPEGPAVRAERPRRLGRSPRHLFGEYLDEAGGRDPRLVALFDELHDLATEDADAPDPA